jgi:tRNA(ile)-lysidine synthetase, C-terminal domain
VLLQLARGSGLKGAAGIPAIRGRLVRPLLEVSRAEVEAYLGRRGQNFVEDESNATDSFARNRLRRDILPRFRTDINSEAVRHFARAGRYFREADEYFETLAGEKAQVLVQREGSSVRIARQALLSEPDIVSSYLLRHLLDAVGCARKDISARHLEALRSLAAKEHGKRIALPQGFLAERCGEALVLRRAEENGKCESQEKPLPGPEAITARSFPRTAGAEPPKDPYVQWFDSDKLPKHWEIRTRRSGDKIAMQGGWHKSLRALMTEAKMPLDSRDRLPLLVSETGELIWAVGLRSSAAYWVDETTTDILELRYEGEKV